MTHRGPFQPLLFCDSVTQPCQARRAQPCSHPGTQRGANSSDGHNDSSRTCAAHKGRGEFQLKCSKGLFPSPLWPTAVMSTVGTGRDFHLGRERARQSQRPAHRPLGQKARAFPLQQEVKKIRQRICCFRLQSPAARSASKKPKRSQMFGSNQRRSVRTGANEL